MKNPQSICHEWRAETSTAFKYLSENYNPKLTQIDKKQRNLNVAKTKLAGGEVVLKKNWW